MIRARLLCVAVLLAGTACTATSTATEATSQQEPAEVAVEQGAGPQQEVQDQDSAEAFAAGPAPSIVAFLDQLEQLRSRIDALDSGARQTLDEVQASFDAARAHSQAVFARIASLKIVLEEAGFSGDVLEELDKLELEAVQLSETAESLQEELNGHQAALRVLSPGLADIEAEVAALDAEGEGEAPAPEALPQARLRDLDGEVAAIQSSGAVQDLLGRSDKLISRVAVLVSRVDRTERKLVAVAARSDGADGDVAAAAEVAASVTTDATGFEEEDDTQTPKGEIAEITTNKGTLLLQFFPDVAPAHVQNFKRLVRDGFYDGLTFHRVLPGYVAQGGCPSGDGFGGPGWQLDNEFNRRPHRRGTLSMARFAHPDSAGSQFFICLDDRPELDGKQTVFGRVIRGEDTLRAIEALSNSDGDGTPSEPITIQQIILRPWQQGDNETSMIAGNPVR